MKHTKISHVELKLDAKTAERIAESLKCPVELIYEAHDNGNHTLDLIINYVARRAIKVIGKHHQ